jgi:hypothetical protein
MVVRAWSCFTRSGRVVSCSKVFRTCEQSAFRDLMNASINASCHTRSHSLVTPSRVSTRQCAIHSNHGAVLPRPARRLACEHPPRGPCLTPAGARPLASAHPSLGTLPARSPAHIPGYPALPTPERPARARRLATLLRPHLTRQQQARPLAAPCAMARMHQCPRCSVGRRTQARTLLPRLPAPLRRACCAALAAPRLLRRTCCAALAAPRLLRRACCTLAAPSLRPH